MQLWQIKGRHEATETMARETKDGDSEKATTVAATVAATTATTGTTTTASRAVQGHVKGNDRSQTIVQVAGREQQQKQSAKRLR